MTEGLEAITTASLRLALDAASLRHQAISANIANANAIGYVRQSVNFEEQLAEVRSQLRSSGAIDSVNLFDIKPKLQSSATGEKIQLDVEVADLAQNNVQYQTLLKALSRHYSLLSSAISDGKK